MSTDDTRSRAAGGYSDSGLSDPTSYDDEGGYSSQSTTVLPGSTSFDSSDFDFDEEPRKPAIAWHGGLDFGLLVLRLALGGLFVAHGLDSLTGWFDGLGRGGTEQLLTSFHFHDVKVLTWVLAISETGGGALLFLGLFTPVGAAAVLAVMANVIAVKANWHRFAGDVELETMYAVAAFTLLFTGPGRVSIDRNTHWARKPAVYGLIFLIIAGGLTATTLLVFR